ncbi:MAG TPA: type III pantothenate kinase [Gemmatimonadaceae bacterium]|nr:type III pantothenate kinase [Gemmatimonadaceae bacterium]
MLLVFDVGNTETTIGCFAGEELRAHWRVTSDVERTPDELSLLIRGLLQTADIAPSEVSGVCIGSVVPMLTAPLAEACHSLTQQRPVVVDGRSPLPITLDVVEPQTVGADRILNTLAASRLFGRDTIVVDLGTATTFDCITKDGVFLGGVIAPGVRTAMETLVRRTSKLPQTELYAPTEVIGRRTEDCIRSGVIYGSADAIDGLVRRIRTEWPGDDEPLVVATGGLAEAIAPFCESFERVVPELTLVGLRLAHELMASVPAAPATDASRSQR